MLAIRIGVRVEMGIPALTGEITVPVGRLCVVGLGPCRCSVECDDRGDEQRLGYHDLTPSGLESVLGGGLPIPTRFEDGLAKWARSLSATQRVGMTRECRSDEVRPPGCRSGIRNMHSDQSGRTASRTPADRRHCS